MPTLIGDNGSERRVHAFAVGLERPGSRTAEA